MLSFSKYYCTLLFFFFSLLINKSIFYCIKVLLQHFYSNFKIVIVKNCVWSYLEQLKKLCTENFILSVRKINMPRTKFISIKDSVEWGRQKISTRHKRMHLIDNVSHHPDLFFVSFPLSFSLSLFLPSPSIQSDRDRNYYFLTSTKRLILQRSIYRNPRWQPSHVGEWLRFARTVASSTLHTILRR